MRTAATIAFSVLLVVGFLGWAAVATGGWLAFPAAMFGAGRGLPALVAPLPGLLFGLALGALAPGLLKLVSPEPTTKPALSNPGNAIDDVALSPLSIAVVFAVTATLALTVLEGVRSGDLAVSRAILALVCGGVTLLVAFYALDAIRRGEGLSVESHWGGLGGGLGGWRVSASTALVFLLLVLLSGTAAVSLMTPEAVLALARKPDPVATTTVTEKPGAASATAAAAAGTADAGK